MSDHKCEFCDAFELRLQISFNRIKTKLQDKELNNIYFLLLYELPFIFLDGKLIAGFYSSTKNSKSKKRLQLFSQPLNTLHLTERVIKSRTFENYDHFESILNNKLISYDGRKGKIFKKDFKLISLDTGAHLLGSSCFEKGGKKILLDYMGLIRVKEGRNFGQYTKSNDSEVYSLQIPFFEKKFLYILWSSGGKVKEKCIEERHARLTNKLEKLGSELDGQYFKPFCLKVINPVPFKESLTFESIEQYLYGRVYLDSALETISQTIQEVLKEIKEEQDKRNDPFRAIFFRTKKPDVNYLVIPVTPGMIHSIYNKIKKKSVEEVLNDIKTMHRSFFKYYKDNIKPSLEKHAKKDGLSHKQIEWEDICFDRELVEGVLENLSSNKNVSKIKIEEIMKNITDLSNLLKQKKNKKYILQKDYLRRNHNFLYLFLILLYKAAMEHTPLAAGVTYNVGKRGVVDYSFNWHEHPFGKLHTDKYDRYHRYPKYFEMIDDQILSSEKYSDRVDIPLIFNGKLFGVFNIYIPIDLKGDIQKFQGLVSELIDIVERYRPDIMRAYFLDVCANITDMLGRVREEKSEDDNSINKKGKKNSLDLLIKDVEDFIRYTHGVPRTYIVMREKISEKLEEVFGCECSGPKSKNSAICEFCKTIQIKIEEFFSGSYKTKKIEELVIDLNKFLNLTDAKHVSSKLLERIQNGQENLYTDKWYFNIKLLNLEKKDAVILQVHIKQEEQRSMREKLNATYLTEAIETGLRAYERKEEIIRHGTRAAVAAIMGRNMSHNIGSHVLSYWNSDLMDQNMQLCIFFETIKKELENLEDINQLIKLVKANGNKFNKHNAEKKENDNILEKSYFLFDYLKNRMDFIAEITTTQPSWEKTMLLKTEIITPFLRQRAILDNLIKSEGFCYVPYLNTEECVKFYNGGSCSNCTTKVKTGNTNSSAIDENGFEPFIIKPDFEDIPVSIPHGAIGVQAVYSILENFFRNSAKHGGKDVRDKLKKNRTNGVSNGCFLITIKAKDEGDYVAFTIMDNVGNCNEEVEVDDAKGKRVIDLLNKAIDDPSYVDAGGKLKKGTWGIKEIKLSANFLRKRDTDSLVDKSRIDNSDLKRPLVSLSCYEDKCKQNSTCQQSKNEQNIAFTVYLSKPKEAFIVYDKQTGDIKKLLSNNRELKKHGVEMAHIDEVKKALENSENIPHRFLILNSAVVLEEINLNDLKKGNRERLPYRIMVNGSTNKRNVVNHGNTLNLKEIVNTNIDYTPLKNGNIVQFICNLYKEYADVKFGKDYKIFITDVGQNVMKQWMDDDICFVNNNKGKLSECSQKAIVLHDHGTEYDENRFAKCFYYHPFGSAIGFTFDMFIRRPPKQEDGAKKRLALYELIEMANVKIVIADERIFKNNKGKTVPVKSSIRPELIKLLREKMGVSIIEVLTDRISEDIIKKDQNKGNFLVIHQGLIDKMTDKTKFWRLAREAYAFIVIDSGRGVPEKLETGTRYLEIGALESFIDELDKYSLVQTLYSLRRPRDE